MTRNWGELAVTRIGLTAAYCQRFRDVVAKLVEMRGVSADPEFHFVLDVASEMLGDFDARDSSLREQLEANNRDFSNDSSEPGQESQPD